MKKIVDSVLPLNILICIGAIITILYTMVFLGWKPCPMCLLQQLCVFIILVFSILGHTKKNPKSFSLIVKLAIILTIIGGIYIAGDQVYIQYFPAFPVEGVAASCDITNPFLTQISKSISGSVQSCTLISEEVTGVSLAVYSLGFFIFMFFMNIFALFINILKKK